MPAASTTRPTPELIYRQGPDRPKRLSLHRPQDWATGLSFTNTTPTGGFIALRPSNLQSAGYVVRPDGGEPVDELWGGQPVTDPNTGQQATFPEGHVTNYHSDRAYWDRWHQSDLANRGTPDLSPQLQAQYELRERLVRERQVLIMSAQAQLTLTDLLFYLRQRLCDAAERHDQPALVELQNTLVLIEEAAWQSRDERLAALAGDMIDAARDALIGVKWKSTIPTDSAIEALRSSTIG